MPANALVLLAEGAEEMETVIVVDVLRRGGVEVVLAGLAGSAPVVCSRQVSINPDLGLSEALGKNWDVVVLPGGGPGAAALAASPEVGKLLAAQEKENRLVAAVCAAPTALLAHGVFKGKRITSYPAFKAKLEAEYEYSEAEVEEDGVLVTSRGPGTSFKFALTLVKRLVSEEKADEVAKAMLV